MKTEIAIGSTLKEVEKFDKTNMKNVDVQEKNPLPDKEGKSFLEFCDKKHFQVKKVFRGHLYIT